MRAFGLLLVFFVDVSTGSAQTADDILGKWLSASGGAQIEIYKQGEEYFGKIIWLRRPNDNTGKPKTDVNNPDPALRDRPAIGLPILSGFRYTDSGLWDGGTVYDPKSGKTYRSRMKLRGQDRLDIRGFVGVSLLGKTVNWRRAK